jgi:hypothetical protein
VDEAQRGDFFNEVRNSFHEGIESETLRYYSKAPTIWDEDLSWIEKQMNKKNLGIVKTQDYENCENHRNSKQKNE